MKFLYNWGSSRYVVYLMHAFFWLLLMLPLLMETGNPRFPGDGFRYRMLFNNLALMFLFYWNAYFLYGFFYRKRGVAVYVLAVVVSALVLMYGLSFAVDAWMPPPLHFPPGPRSPLFHYPFYLAIIAVSFSYSMIREHNQREKQRKERETATLKTELDLLRSQISPHFMFNVLNSLVALARRKSDLLEPSLLQLSALMRYVLYENNHSRIALSEELAYLSNYIELQSLRFGDDILLDVRLPEHAEVLDGYEIEPMLLIPFIENAFKHGTGSVQEPFIRIRISMDRNTDLLNFSISNRVGLETDVKDGASGIGLKNVKRRLELLYPERHVFGMQENEGLFEAILTLKLV